MSLRYQQYWDNEEYRAGLRDEIDAAVERGLSIAADKRVITDAVMSMVFKSVKLHTWCDREGCFQPYCQPTHYAFRLQTHPREFEPEAREA